MQQLRRRARHLRVRAQLRHEPRKIVVGSSGIAQQGWTPTDRSELDLLEPRTWQALLAPGTVDAILAEHVWEHLTLAHGEEAARTCFRYLRPGGRLRVAVPDGLHPDPNYIDAVKPGGTGSGADDHQVLYDHRTLAALFVRAGFTVELLEHFDEEGHFRFTPWSPVDGFVRRSSRFDERNRGGALAYTSLILDARKPE